MIKKAKIISAFHCTGKSSLITGLNSKHLKIKYLDNDSSISIDNINEYRYNYYDIIIIDANKELIGKLMTSNIKISLVIPDISLMYEYIGRMYLNGYSESCINHAKENWNHIIELNILDYPCIEKIYRLNSNTYINDVIFYLK